MILLNAYNNPRAAQWLSERIQAPVVTLPFSVGGTRGSHGPVRPVRRHPAEAPAAAQAMSPFSADLSILWPALVAGVLVVLSHVPLGQQVLQARHRVHRPGHRAGRGARRHRRAVPSGLELAGWQTQVAAVAAALLGALLLTWTERRRPEVQEALIGVLFVLASTAQILLLANNPHGGEELKDLLAGQILWVSTEQLLRAAILTAMFLLVWFRWRERIGHVGFYVLFSPGGDAVGAAGRRLPGVHDADRARARDVSARPGPAAQARLPGCDRELRRRARGVPRHRPALEPGDRLGDGCCSASRCTSPRARRRSAFRAR